MKISKFEAIGIGTSFALMAIALYMVRAETLLLGAVPEKSQSAAVTKAVVVDSNDDNNDAAWKEALTGAADDKGNLQKLVIEDIKVGTGD